MRKYRLEVSEEQFILIVAMLGIALEDADTRGAYADETGVVMRSLATTLLSINLPKNVREVLAPVLQPLELQAIR